MAGVEPGSSMHIPHCHSPSTGISCKVRLEDVLAVLAASRVHRDGKWVIQKYIGKEGGGASRYMACVCASGVYTKL